MALLPPPDEVELCAAVMSIMTGASWAGGDIGLGTSACSACTRTRLGGASGLQSWETFMMLKGEWLLWNYYCAFLGGCIWENASFKKMRGDKIFRGGGWVKHNQSIDFVNDQQASKVYYDSVYIKK